MKAPSSTLLHVLAVALAAAAVGCHSGGSSTSASVSGTAPAHNYQLSCGAPTTATTSELRCVRTDTRNGDVLVVNYMKLPVSNGPTASAADAPGTYTTACASTSTRNRADFYCVRLNTRTGDLLMVNLPKVGTFPPGGSAVAAQPRVAPALPALAPRPGGPAIGRPPAVPRTGAPARPVPKPVSTKK